MFVIIERGTLGDTKVPDNSLRVNRGTMGLAANILPSDNDKVRFGIAVDVEAKRIKLVPNDIRGFTFGRRAAGKAFSSPLSKKFHRVGMPRGIYGLVDEEDLIFELREEA